MPLLLSVPTWANACGDNGFFGLPEVDWPLCGLWSSAMLAGLKQTFSSVVIAEATLQRLGEEDEEKEMAYDSIRQLKANISHCLQNKQNLISFCH